MPMNPNAEARPPCGVSVAPLGSSSTEDLKGLFMNEYVSPDMTPCTSPHPQNGQRASQGSPLASPLPRQSSIQLMKPRASTSLGRDLEMAGHGITDAAMPMFPDFSVAAPPLPSQSPHSGSSSSPRHMGSVQRRVSATSATSVNSTGKSSGGGTSQGRLPKTAPMHVAGHLCQQPSPGSHLWSPPL